MTHVDNIPHILEYGITHVNSPNANPQYVPIGDPSIISTRSNFVLDNGRILGDYIPFYFGFRMPMLYVIQNGFKGVTPTKPNDIVYCVSSVEKVLSLGCGFIFTDGHAVNAFSTQFSSLDYNKMRELLDQKAIAAKFWKNDEDLDLKRRKEAEFLLDGDLDQNGILGYVVYDLGTKQKLIGWGIDEKLVHIGKHYYF